MHHHAGGQDRREFLRRGLLGTAALLGGAAYGRVDAAGPAAGALLEEAARDATPAPPPLRVPDRSASAPAAPVAIQRARSYEREEIAAVLKKCFDGIGGIRKLASGKTVTVKLNTTGNGRQRLRGLPAERTYQVHPHFVEVLCGLLHGAGARRIYLVESFYRQSRPEEILGSQRWDVAKIESAGGHKVHWEDTRNRGGFKDYVRLDVPWGGYVFPGYHLNRRYAETDVLVSLAKVKNHITAGITGAVKNLFGIAPTGLYGNDAPNEETVANRADCLHFGTKQPPAGVAPEHDPERLRFPDKVRESYYRVPMVTADLFGVRPVDLAIVDGIETCRGGEGPWCPNVQPIAPGLVLAGRNAVTTDAIMAAVMGYDPTASAGDDVWYGYNHLELLARAGAGTNDPAKIEVAGVPLREALHEFYPGLNGWVKKHL